jgi:hypothetical protein
LRIDIVDTGSSIWFKSADREDGLRGETVNFLVVDETGLLKRDAWEFALHGTITITKATCFFIGTPKGKNLFYELYCKGQDETLQEWISWQLDSRSNKFFDEEEWENVRRLPQRAFEQEYLAKFIDDGGEVFRNIRGCIAGQLEDNRNNKKAYYAGIDLAKTVDYTVITVMDSNGHLCFFDRFNAISWDVQKKRIIAACARYDAFALIDSTGIGDPILEDLQNDIRCEGFKFSNISKRQLIENLVLLIDRQEISFPEIPELVNELSIFQFEQTSGGVIRYNAPAGMHDDIVVSLALASMAYSRTRGGLNSFDYEDNRMTVIESW